MKTGYVIASTIAFAVSCTLTNAMPFSPTAIPNSLKGIANNRDVDPIVEPAIIFQTPGQASDHSSRLAWLATTF